MDRPADLRTETENGHTVVRLLGDWTAASIGRAGQALAEATSETTVLDFTEAGRVDTAGAYAAILAMGGFDAGRVRARTETLRLLTLVSGASRVRPAAARQPNGLRQLTERVGRGVIGFGAEFIDTMGFLGHFLVVMIQTLRRLVTDPRRLRWAPIVGQMERAGLDAIPIVALTTAFIGAVVAVIGVDMLQQFGADVYSVELIAVAVLREFNIVITAVLLAGRSASAFAAELGSMKMNQEVAAMQVMGVDPFEALVLPRFAALVLTTPLLMFIATLAGLAGGMIVTWTTLGLSPAFFLQRILDNVSPNHFYVALSKAPVMAAVVAGIGCRQGLLVGGDVESLGRRVTSAVVQAIFSIIMLDAIFAIVYMRLDI